MSWRKISKEELSGRYAGFDIVVRKNYIYIPTNSVIRKIEEKRYDIYIDRENGRVALLFNANGDYKIPNDYIIRAPKGRLHSVVRLFNDVLGIGKYKGNEEGIEGKRAIVFGGE